MIWSAEAPANIALIKYMGKGDENAPLNSSLSFTLPLFRTHVTLEAITGEDAWVPMTKFSLKDQEKFLRHLSFLKEHFSVRQSFLVDSRNNFPAHCGLASSASSFAALTLCAAHALSNLKNVERPSIDELSRLSRRGSGSSCRSLFSPFALWDQEGCRAVELPKLLHQVVVVDGAPKEVSSSEAHQRVRSSSLWNGRPERAEKRLQVLLEALKHNRWKEAYETVWAEFWDMHALFETSQPPFGYMQDDSLKVLRAAQKLWQDKGDGPLVTMDAGPNVHLLYRFDQKDLMIEFQEKRLMGFQILGDFAPIVRRVGI